MVVAVAKAVEEGSKAVICLHGQHGGLRRGLHRRRRPQGYRGSAHRQDCPGKLAQAMIHGARVLAIENRSRPGAGAATGGADSPWSTR